MNRSHLRKLAFVFWLAALTVPASKSTAIRLHSTETSSPLPELVLQRGHSQGATSATFAPDGTWLASGAADNSVLIWQLPSGRHLRTLTGHRGPIRSVAISGNGELLASGSNDRTIKVWHAAKGTDTFTLTGHTGSITSLAFSPGGDWLVSGSSDKTIRVWDLKTGKQLHSLDDQAAEVDVLAVSKSGEFLASATGNEIRLRDVRKWKDSRTLRRHNAVVKAIAFSSDGNLIASGSVDGTVLIWQRGSDRELFALKSNPSSVLALSFAVEGTLIAAHSDGAIDSWNSSRGQKQFSLTGDMDTGAAVFASFSSDGSTLAFGIGERKLNLRSTTNGSLIGKLES